MDAADPFKISPLPPLDAIAKGSVDLSLGRTFLVAVRASIGSVRADEPGRSGRLFTEVRLSGDD